MDTSGLDGEDYIAAIRAGAIDPHGQSADELQDALDAFDREWSERLATLSDDDVDAVIAGRMEVPPLPGPVESEHARRDRLERDFTGRMRALRAQRARLEAEERELLAARFQRVQEAGGEMNAALREAASTLAAELRLSDRSIERQMTDAWTTVRELPVAHEAHKSGRISTGHLRTIAQTTEALRLDSDADPQERARVEAELVSIAESTTPGRLRSRAKRIVDRAMTAPLQQRHTVARDKRGVWGFDAGDGMMDVLARVPAVHGVGIIDRLTQGACNMAKDDPRTFDQFRADAFAELLLTGTTPEDVTGVNAITATVSITIPATELLAELEEDDGDAHHGRDGLRDEHEDVRDERDDQPERTRLRFPAMLDGRILVDAATVRQLGAEAATWERLFLDPVTGLPVTVDTYRPSRAQRRWLRARDGHCRWPGCSNPVSRADADHTRNFAAGGRTTLSNLAHLCKRHHSMKHTTRWTVRQLPGGVLEWTSPLGDVYLDVPEPQGPRFVDLPDAEPIWDAHDPPPAEPEPEWAHAPEYAEHAPDGATSLERTARASDDA